MTDRPWTKYWIDKFLKDSAYRRNRFKILHSGYPQFELTESLADEVGVDEFSLIEKNRIPLFIGTQFGIFPRVNEMPHFFNGKKIIAVLGKSLLSGAVAGLSIYLIRETEKEFLAENISKIAYFKN